MVLNALVDSFLPRSKKCGTERVKVQIQIAYKYNEASYRWHRMMAVVNLYGANDTTDKRSTCLFTELLFICAPVVMFRNVLGKVAGPARC